MRGKQAARAAARRQAAADELALKGAARSAELADRLTKALGREAAAAQRLIALSPYLDALTDAERDRAAVEAHARRSERAVADARTALQNIHDVMMQLVRGGTNDGAQFDWYGFPAILELVDLGHLKRQFEDRGEALHKFRTRAGSELKPLASSSECPYPLPDWG